MLLQRENIVLRQRDYVTPSHLGNRRSCRGQAQDQLFLRKGDGPGNGTSAITVLYPIEWSAALSMEQRSATTLSHLNQQMTDVPIADLQPLGSFALRELLLPYISQHALSQHLDSGGNKASY